jgi:hypothetical protein
MIKVLSRSSAESTSEAVREIEDEYSTAMTFAATSRTLTMVLTMYQPAPSHLSCLGEAPK